MPNTTWNPADKTNCTLTGSNLVATTAAGGGGVRGVDAKTAGKFYVEYTYTTLNTNSIAAGIALFTTNLATLATGAAYAIRLNGNISVNNSLSGSTLGAISAAAVIGVAVDFTAQLVWFRKAPSGSWNGSGSADPATGVGGVSISAIAGSLFPVMGGSTSDSITANFGDTAFTGTVPSGFTAGFPAGGGAAAAQACVMVLA